MATYSTTTIVNYALVLCGATTVTTITDDTPNARALNTVYDFCRKNFLTENKWTFSTTRSTLATVSTANIAWLHNDESFAYTKPTGCLKIWEVNSTHVVWREESDYIIASVADLGIKWSYDQTDHTKWSPSAVEAFCYKLASEIAYQVLNSGTTAAALKKYYNEVALPDAMSKNSQIGEPQQVLDDSWEASKYGATGGDPSRSYS